MSYTAVLRSDEILTLERQLAARNRNQQEHITQAGLATAAHLRNLYPGSPLHFLVAAGRKGAIALTAAIELHQSNNCCEVLISRAGELTQDDLAFNQVFQQAQARVPDSLWVTTMPSPKSIIIDGMYGFDHELSQSQSEYCAEIAELPNCKVAIEIPSGVEADTGRCAPLAVGCDNTIAFTMPMVCHMLPPGREKCGSVHICPVGIETSDVEALDPPLTCNTMPQFAAILPATTVNKYSRGAVAVVASRHMPGAAYLASAAAQRAGAGAVFILTPPQQVFYYQQMLPSAIVVECKNPKAFLDAAQDRRIASLVVGPGLLEIREESDFLAEFLALDKPTVVDASALDALHPIRYSLPKRVTPLVITPHQAEFARLLPELADEHPLAAVQSAARLLNATFLLKGFTSLIAAKCKVVFNVNAKPVLAVAGSGDVLSGMIGALLCRLDDGQAAASFAAWWHAAAGRSFGLTAEDIIANLPEVAEIELSS